MVSVINAGKSLRNTLNYNEQKLKQGKATLLHSSGFGKDTERLSFKDKLGHLEKLAARNERTTVNSIHISLNFDPSEKLSTDTLRQIAETYLQKIGFEGQPFLVYQHHDAGHPHIHLVTTNIRPNGKRIKLHNIGRNQSEKARKAIEKEFNLVRADKNSLRTSYELKPVNAQKVQYGQSETKRAITTVLDAILPAYKYTSIPELNAVLRSYNVQADQGSKDSRISKANGLVYRVLDDAGRKVGVPIKASDIYNKPTMKNLEKRFQENEVGRQAHKVRVKNAVDLAILRQPGLSIDALAGALQKENIQLVVRQNANRIIYGLTYVDHKTKSVFNGSALGKAYSANQVQERCQGMSIHPPTDVKPSQKAVPPTTSRPAAASHVPQDPEAVQPSPRADGSLFKEIAGEIFDPQYSGGLAAELREDIKKKRKKKLRI